MRHLICIAAAVAVALAMPVMAQDLDTVTVSDTLDSGARGNEAGTGGLTAWGDTLQDGTEYSEITDTAGVTGTIRYMNSWAGASAGDATHGESGVVNVTAAHDSPDRDLAAAIAAIAANSNDSVSPNTAVLVGDDGGFNGLYFGENDDANYYIQADVFCFDRTSPGTGYEVHEVALRTARDNDPADIETGAYSSDRSGGYSLAWDAQLGIASARRWEANWSGGTALGSTEIANRDVGTFTEFASLALTEGWHTFRIEAYGSQITFSVDGSELIEVNDSTYANGRPGLVYRESGVDSALETQGHFDNLSAGPAAAPPIPQTALEPPFEYIGSFPAALPPLALATDGSALYYATFTGVAATPEAAYHIVSPEDEIGGADLLDHTVIATEPSFPAGRAFQGIGVDSAGNVYLSGDDGTAPGVLLKFGPAPTFTPDTTFNTNATTNGTNRWGGLALLGDDAVAVAAFNSINYFSAADASIAGFTNVGGGDNYQREPVYNAADNVIYALRNGVTDPAILTGLYEGGTTTTGNYAFTSSVLIADGATATAFGTATGHGCVDNGVSPPRLYTVDSQAVATGGSDPLIRVWEIGAGGDSLTLLGSISSNLGAAGWTTVSDCVVIGNFLYVSSAASGRIYVYGGSSATAVNDYALYR